MPRRLNFDPSQGVRDGSWIVDPRVVERYRAMGIDALNDPAHADDEVARDIEANRMEYSQARNRMRQNNVNRFNDENWNGEAQAAGYGDWRESRRKTMKAYQADPVKFWQMAGNGGGGDLSKQPTQDDLDRFSHWLWITNPANQREVMNAFSGPKPPTQPPPPVMPPTPITPTNIVRPTPKPKPALTTSRQQPAADTTGIPGMGIQPSVISQTPTPTANRNYTRRPPQTTGYMKPQRTVAQLGF